MKFITKRGIGSGEKITTGSQEEHLQGKQAGELLETGYNMEVNFDFTSFSPKMVLIAISLSSTHSIYRYQSQIRL